MFFVAFILNVPACGASPATLAVNPPVVSTIPVPSLAQGVAPTSMPASEEATKEPALTLTSPSEVVFDLSNANTVLPEDVLEEIRYYGGGGGPIAGFNMNFCQNEEKPTLIFELTQMTDVEISNGSYSPISVTCGWQKDEQVTVTMINPEGQIYVQNEAASPEYRFADASIKGYYVALLDMPVEVTRSEASNTSDLFMLHGIDQIMLGSYQIQFEGQSGSVQTTIQITGTTQGRVERSSSGGLILFGFVPNERVRIIFYPDQQPPIWHEYQVGPNGELWIKEFPDGGTYAIFGERSGYITTLWGSTSALKCGDALPTRTQPGRWLYLATFLKGEGLPLHTMPDSASPITAIFPYESPQGSYVLTISEPSCGENSTWWKVQTVDNQIGWAMESDEHSYYLIDEFGPSFVQDCEGEFVVGQSVRVTFTDGKPLNLRQTPELSAPILDKIPEGTKLIIKDGPRCASDHTVWWYIEMDAGHSGWVAQGNGDVYYLEPWR